MQAALAFQLILVLVNGLLDNQIVMASHIPFTNYRAYDDGSVLRVNSDASIDVQVGYREFPYQGVSTNVRDNVADNFHSGDQAKTCHLNVNPLLPFVIKNFVIPPLSGLGTPLQFGNGQWVTPECQASLPYGITVAAPTYNMQATSTLIATLGRTADASPVTELSLCGQVDPRGVLNFNSS